jgi:hypothetical protein
VDYLLLEDHLALTKLPTAVRTRSNQLPAKRRKLARTASASSHLSDVPAPDLFKVVDFEWLKQSLIYGRVLTPQLFASNAS